MQIIAWIVLFVIGKNTEKLSWKPMAIVIAVASGWTALSIVLRNMERSAQGREAYAIMDFQTVALNALLNSAIFLIFYLLGYVFGRWRRSKTSGRTD